MRGFCYLGDRVNASGGCQGTKLRFLSTSPVGFI